MSELHKFIFEGLPVRGALVRLTGAWQEVLQRRAANTQTGPYPEPVRTVLGEMSAAAVLMQSNIKFDGALVLQVAGDGPVKVAVVEVQPDFSFRSTATLAGEVPPLATLGEMVNQHGSGRCAITLDPRQRLPGQQPYQGVVPLTDDDGRALPDFAAVLQQYMLRSEQLQTTLVLAADDHIAAGLLIQRLPVQGAGNLEGTQQADAAAMEEHYNRIATLASSLKREELLTLDADTVLRRLFWEETLNRFEPLVGDSGPRFACSCSRERVGKMILGLGQEDAEALAAERGHIEVGCEFCGKQYRFDAVDTGEVFTEAARLGSGGTQAH
ncbi:Hsp33 family molecular chaperone HslO [Curvibacter sp. APW13]|uniref:Hsp33 family molecular chaperone HslO n=1 Tax=Curvibacter sp. APW13 TaxID=3077236 RepID=UPI0028DDFE0F|nr:Hsp33 family molecular chaperone HslO [Curvibacter sp. APW13]MDT8991009.1 Hsp33 family molecular chaperone HslO [Curvibacter sp. APW13]